MWNMVKEDDNIWCCESSFPVFSSLELYGLLEGQWISFSDNEQSVSRPTLLQHINQLINHILLPK